MKKYRVFCIVALVVVLVAITLVLFSRNNNNSKEVFDGTLIRNYSYINA